MKTPKEILLQRHQAMERKLNAVRHNALASLSRPGLAERWREFVFSLRWHLAGMSAVWLVVLVLHFDPAPGSTMVIARENIPSARVLVTSLVENRRKVAELTETPPPATEPSAAAPRRSEIPIRMEVV